MPLPLRVDNPYRVTLSSALQGQIAVPEGPLCWASSLLENWLKSLQHAFAQMGVTLTFDHTQEPPFRFCVHVHGKPPEAEERRVLLDLGRALNLPTPPSLVQICQVVDANAAYIPATDMYEFASLLKDELSPTEWNRYLQRFPSLDMDRNPQS